MRLFSLQLSSSSSCHITSSSLFFSSSPPQSFLLLRCFVFSFRSSSSSLFCSSVSPLLHELQLFSHSLMMVSCRSSCSPCKQAHLLLSSAGLAVSRDAPVSVFQGEGVMTLRRSSARPAAVTERVEGQTLVPPHLEPAEVERSICSGMRCACSAPCLPARANHSSTSDPASTAERAAQDWGSFSHLLYLSVAHSSSLD